MRDNPENQRPADEDADPIAAADGASFVERWQGAFEPAEREDERYRGLAEKYLLRAE